MGRIGPVVPLRGRSMRGTVLATSPDDFRSLWETNFLSAVRCVQAFAEVLIESRGHVVLIGSLASKVAAGYLGAYPASKFPLAALRSNYASRWESAVSIRSWSAPDRSRATMSRHRERGMPSKEQAYRPQPINREAARKCGESIRINWRNKSYARVKDAGLNWSCPGRRGYCSWRPKSRRGLVIGCCGRRHRDDNLGTALCHGSVLSKSHAHAATARAWHPSGLRSARIITSSKKRTRLAPASGSQPGSAIWGGTAAARAWHIRLKRRLAGMVTPSGYEWSGEPSRTYVSPKVAPVPATRHRRPADLLAGHRSRHSISLVV